MTKHSWFTSRRGPAALAIVALAAALAIVPSSAATTYSVPAAPSKVTATPVVGGVLVSWTAPDSGNASITSYSVTGGPGTCAVTVNGTTTSAFVPAVAGQPAATFKVVATNSLGDSVPGASADKVLPLAGRPIRVIDSTGFNVMFGLGSTLNIPAVLMRAIASTNDGNGAWIANAKGRVRAVGTAASIDATLPGTIAIVPTADGSGLTLVSRTGVVRSFGSATLSADLTKSGYVAAVPAAKGLWVFGANGSVTALGGAPAVKLSGNGVVKAATALADGTGGWVLRANGNVEPFGSAPALSDSFVGAVNLWRTPSGKGVWVLTSNGSIKALGDADARPATGPLEPFAIIPAGPDTTYQSVTIDEFSDFHGQIEANGGIGGAAALKVYWDADKAKGTTIVASGGDNFGAAPPISAQFDELPTVLAENKMGVDVTGLGNHEHDRTLAHLQKMIDASIFPWVGSNYSNYDKLTGIKPYVIVERGGVKVGFVAANNQETSKVSAAAALGTITFADPVASLNAAITQARAAGAQIVVALTHYGYAETVGDKATGPLLDIAAGLKGADLVFGAHTHLKWTGRVGGTLVSQAVNAGANYVRNTICRDARSGAIVGTAGEIVVPAVKDVTPDASIASFVKEYADQIALKFDGKIATVTGVFPFGGSPAVQRQGEVAIGDYFADIIRKKYGTQIALINGGGIRANIPALTYKPKDTTLVRPTSVTDTRTLDVTLGDVYTVLPFGNQLATTSITGAGLWSALENGVSQYEAVAGRFPQISGFKFTFDVKKPVGSRVVSVTLSDGTAVPNDASKSYTLTTLDYMISGGDGYTQFNPSKAVIRDLYAQVIADAMIAEKTVMIPALDGRITKL